MAYDWWNLLGGFRLLGGCLGAALVDLLGGVMDFKDVDAFGVVLETGLTLVLDDHSHFSLFFF